MQTFITVIHVVLCVFMIFVILLQPGTDAGMGAALGGGAATSAFGGRGAVTFLSKVTAVCAGLFFVTSLGLSMVGLKPSVTDTTPQPTNSQPAQPAVNPPANLEAAPAGQPGGASPAENSATTTGNPSGNSGPANQLAVPPPAGGQNPQTTDEKPAPESGGQNK